ncbi:YaaR family protein [Paenibacillus glacialis]|uniref:DUF327 domain-containing protein n=1 Tax=Paenibacillus glacialis TaxID=494026 RepID=A0A162MDU0_9BACL|nr:YaaR family protein [Paenibacillus glacialis]OAB42763.1 hypothetical protein PGLA_11525 [Paenibacillus glacialis]
MKINPGYRPIKSELPNVDTSAKPPLQRSFSDVIQQQSQIATQEELGRRLKEIQMQGDRLARAMTIRELKAYRTMIKRFLEDTVRRAVSMKETRGWDRRGRGKRYKLIDEIDSALLAMADELLESEEGKIDLLQQMGEIRGMLINLSF